MFGILIRLIDSVIPKSLESRNNKKIKSLIKMHQKDQKQQTMTIVECQISSSAIINQYTVS